MQQQQQQEGGGDPGGSAQQQQQSLPESAPIPQQQQQGVQEQQEQQEQPKTPPRNTKKKNQPHRPPVEYNPRWKGYTYILITSLINISSISNVADANANSSSIDSYEGVWGCVVGFGSVTFGYAFLVLLTDRLRIGLPHPRTSGGSEDSPKEILNYTTAKDGKLEGYCLLAATVWWIFGVATQTQVHGIAYLALNIYFSAWLALASCLYTLEQWSAARDILSFQELTGLSTTLKSWYVLFFSSMVVVGTSINMIVMPYMDDNYNKDKTNDDSIATLFMIEKIEATSPASFGVAFGIATMITSAGFILVHYNIIEYCVEGGWIELIATVCCILIWIIGVSILTQNDGVGATIVGVRYQEIFVPDASFMSSSTTSTSFEDSTFSYIMNTITNETNYENDTTTVDNTMNETDTTDTTNSTAAVIPTPDTCVLWFNQTATTPSISFQCGDFIPYTAIEKHAAVPGSNLYLSVWICLLASVNIAFRWKAQQALHFAQAQHEKNTAAAAEEAAAANAAVTSMTTYDNDYDNDDPTNTDHRTTARTPRSDRYNDYDYDYEDDEEFMDADSY